MRTKGKGVGIVVVIMLLTMAMPAWSAGEGKSAARTEMVVERMTASVHEWLKGLGSVRLATKGAVEEGSQTTGEGESCRPGQSEESCSIDPDG